MRSLTRRSITFNFRRVFTSTCLAVCLVGLLICPAVTMTRNVNQVSAQQQSKKTEEDKQTQRFELKRKAFASGRKLLLDAKVPFEPDRLLTPGWRKNLASTFAQMPEMQTVRQGTKTLKGVQLAHTLYLPEKITLTEDTVILANYLIFEGKDVEIKGAHDIHIYPIDATGLLGTTLQAAANGGRPGFSKVSFRKTALPRGMFFSPLFVQDGKITINVSGRGRTEWLQEQKEKNNRLNAGVRAHHARSTPMDTINNNGAHGSDGTDRSAGNTGLNGNHGGNGSNGVCGGNVNGLAGVGGSVGGDGADGLDGGSAGNGQGGQNITGSASLGVSYTLLSNGGNGGQGGDGGTVALGVWVAMVAEAAMAQIVPVLRAAQAAVELVVPLVPAGLAATAATAKTAEMVGPVDKSYSLILPATLVRFRRPLIQGRVVLAVTVETRVLARAQAPPAKVAME